MDYRTIILVTLGTCATAEVDRLLRNRHETIDAFYNPSSETLLLLP